VNSLPNVVNPSGFVALRLEVKSPYEDFFSISARNALKSAVELFSLKLISSPISYFRTDLGG
jgi:hypothetical protein